MKLARDRRASSAPNRVGAVCKVARSRRTAARIWRSSPGSAPRRAPASWAAERAARWPAARRGPGQRPIGTSGPVSQDRPRGRPPTVGREGDIMPGESAHGGTTWRREAKRVLRVSKEAQPYRTELTPVSFLRRSAYVFPDKTAIVHGERRYTYRQFEERANRLASGLRALGLRHLDRVAVILPEHAGHAGGALRRARGRARARADQHAAEQRRDRLHPAALRRQGPLRRPRVRRRW